ncbi:MAG: sterol desaturase family protein [Bacteroidota bacterium]
MPGILQLIIEGYSGYFAYLVSEITISYDYKPWWQNYFYWLILVSLFFFFLEIARPWRKDQAILRKDFWLDLFYMFFNFFLFGLIIYNAASNVVVNFFNRGIFSLTGMDLQAMNPMQQWPYWAVLLTGFVASDFIQWWTHRLLHRVPALWEFHKVHHSVEQMGFAAHLRYHWMETIVYKTITYLPLALMGIGLYDFFIIHLFGLVVGHFNHSNITVSKGFKGAVLGFLLGWIIAWGLFEVAIFSEITTLQQLLFLFLATFVGYVALGPIMPFLFNSPEMHIWHHSYHLPEGNKYGVNFGLTLAIWDYLFGTNYIPHSGKDIKLGFPGIEEFPNTFSKQVVHGLGLPKNPVD